MLMETSCCVAVVPDDTAISYCGFLCTECNKSKKGICKGCRQPETKSWCRVKNCCIENDIKNCASCKNFSDVADCRLLNSLSNRMLKYLRNSDKVANIKLLQSLDLNSYAFILSKIRKRSINLY